VLLGFLSLGCLEKSLKGLERLGFWIKVLENKWRIWKMSEDLMDLVGELTDYQKALLRAFFNHNHYMSIKQLHTWEDSLFGYERKDNGNEVSFLLKKGLLERKGLGSNQSRKYVLSNKGRKVVNFKYF